MLACPLALDERPSIPSKEVHSRTVQYRPVCLQRLVPLLPDLNCRDSRGEFIEPAAPPRYAPRQSAPGSAQRNQRYTRERTGMRKRPQDHERTVTTLPITDGSLWQLSMRTGLLARTAPGQQPNTLVVSSVQHPCSLTLLPQHPLSPYFVLNNCPSIAARAHITLDCAAPSPSHPPRSRGHQETAIRQVD